jgi:hypothetical protein
VRTIIIRAESGALRKAVGYTIAHYLGSLLECVLFTVHRKGFIAQIRTVCLYRGCVAAAGIGRLVAAAQAREAPVQRVADAVAGKFCYGVMAASAATFTFWQVLGEYGQEYAHPSCSPEGPAAVSSVPSSNRAYRRMVSFLQPLRVQQLCFV